MSIGWFRSSECIWRTARDEEDYSIVSEVDRCNTWHRECCDLDDGASIEQNNQLARVLILTSI
jgi:hypothetical protein